METFLPYCLRSLSVRSQSLQALLWGVYVELSLEHCRLVEEIAKEVEAHLLAKLWANARFLILAKS